MNSNEKNFKMMHFFNLLLFSSILNAGILLSVNVNSNNFEFKISDLHSLIKSKTSNCTDIIDYFLKRSIKYNPLLNAIINYNPKALEEANLLDNHYQKHGTLIGKLHCIPLLVKDNIDVIGIPTTGGIRALRHSIPHKDATVIKRLKSEGAIVIAKANLAELAGEIYDSETGGSCKNPWDTSRSCGPSSTGIGAGISAGLAIIGIGTDTGGSLMNPASFCGLFGLRPPLDDLDFNGIIPLFNRQDTVGPLTRHLDDLVLAYSVMINDSNIYNEFSYANFTGLKVGYLNTFWNNFNFTNPFGKFTYIINSEIDKALNTALLNLKKLNLNVKEIVFDDIEFGSLNDITQQIVITGLTGCIDSCFKSLLEKYFKDNERFQFDSPVKSFEDLLNSPILSTYWKKRLNETNILNPNEKCTSACIIHDSLRKRFRQSVSAWFKDSDVDVILVPTTSDLAFLLDATETQNNINPTFIAPFSGFATISFPIAFSKPSLNAPDGLPIGLMMITPKENLLTAFKIAKLYDNNYIKTKILPKLTPKTEIIDKKCTASKSLSNIPQIMALIMNILFVFFIKYLPLD